jgi:hypothetical protein
LHDVADAQHVRNELDGHVVRADESVAKRMVQVHSFALAMHCAGKQPHDLPRPG